MLVSVVENLAEVGNPVCEGRVRDTEARLIRDLDADCVAAASRTVLAPLTQKVPVLAERGDERMVDEPERGCQIRKHLLQTAVGWRSRLVRAEACLDLSPAELDAVDEFGRVVEGEGVREPERPVLQDAAEPVEVCVVVKALSDRWRTSDEPRGVRVVEEAFDLRRAPLRIEEVEVLGVVGHVQASRLGPESGSKGAATAGATDVVGSWSSD